MCKPIKVAKAIFEVSRDLVAEANAVADNSVLSNAEQKQLGGYSRRVLADKRATLPKLKRLTTTLVHNTLSYRVEKDIEVAGVDAKGRPDLFGKVTHASLAKIVDPELRQRVQRLMGGAPTLPVAELAQAITKAATHANYSSESDYQPQFFSAKVQGAPELTPAGIKRALGPQLLAWFTKENEEPASWNELGFKTYSRTEGKKALTERATFHPEYNSDAQNVAAWAALKKLLEQNLGELTHVRVGPKDEDGRVTDSNGLYLDMFVGRTNDGHLAGIGYGAVET